MRDISTINSKFIIKIGNVPHIVEHFSPESDMWAVDDINTAEVLMTPDGQAIAHTRQAVISASLTLSGASVVAEKLRQVLNNQKRIGDKLAEVADIAVIIESSGGVETYLDGRCVNGPSGFTYGNEKLQDQTFQFQFKDRKFAGNGDLGTTL